MFFYRVHVEITNVCGLKCTFCPPKTAPSTTMKLPFFEHILKELKPFTKRIALHMMGDALTLSNLQSYMDLAHAHAFEVEITTSGFFIGNHAMATLFHPALRQLNISLNSFNKNSPKISFEEYMNQIFLACEYKLANAPKPFINLRLWNLAGSEDEQLFNLAVFDALANFFGISHAAMDAKNAKEGVRLDKKILLHFDTYFEWPSLASTHFSHAACYGLSSHFGILANGSVVPCCLDGEGVIDLGNLHTTPLRDILHSPRAAAMTQGFKENRAVEELCQKCSYKERFMIPQKEVQK